MAKRIAPGEYRTAEGYTVSRSWDDEGRRGDEWHLFDPTGEYCSTYWTKTEALAAVERITRLT